MAPCELQEVLSPLKVLKSKNVLTDIRKSEDAGVYKISDDLALVQTVDFFPPIVDSPFDFGMIAAANSLSDVYAMGARPITAMNIVCFPSEELDKKVLQETLEGALDKINEAGAALVGGHTIDDDSFKYGLSVTGLVHPKKFLKNDSAKTFDKLILTKPLGLGIVATALKAKIAGKDDEELLIKTASTLNKYSIEIAKKFKISACTDVTGFGLMGHLLEIAKASKKKLLINLQNIKTIGNTISYVKDGLIPSGAYKNRDFCKNSVILKTDIERHLLDIAYDPQTSGGLIFAIDKNDAGECLKELQEEGIPAFFVGEVGDNDNKGILEI